MIKTTVIDLDKIAASGGFDYPPKESAVETIDKIKEFKPTILIDFDETISLLRGFDHPPNQSTVEAIDKLKEKFKIVIYSCRANKNIRPATDEILLRDYLFKYKIYYDEIAHNKPVFFAIIDDRCYNPTLTSWDEITKTLIEEAV